MMLFDDSSFGDGWTLDNLPYGYSAPVSALEYNEGSVDLIIRAGAAPGDPVAIQIRSGGSGLQVENKLVTVAETGSRIADSASAGRAVSRVAVRGTDSGESRAVCAHGLGRQPHAVFRRRLSAGPAGRRYASGRRRDGHRRFESKPDQSDARTTRRASARCRFAS